MKKIVLLVIILVLCGAWFFSKPRYLNKLSIPEGYYLEDNYSLANVAYSVGLNENIYTQGTFTKSNIAEIVIKPETYEEEFVNNISPSNNKELLMNERVVVGIPYKEGGPSWYSGKIISIDKNFVFPGVQNKNSLPSYKFTVRLDKDIPDNLLNVYKQYNSSGAYAYPEARFKRDDGDENNLVVPSSTIRDINSKQYVCTLIDRVKAGDGFNNPIMAIKFGLKEVQAGPKKYSKPNNEWIQVKGLKPNEAIVWAKNSIGPQFDCGTPPA